MPPMPEARASARVSSRRTLASLWISSRVMMSKASVSSAVAGEDRGGVVVCLVQGRAAAAQIANCPSPADRHGSANSNGCIRARRRPAAPPRAERRIRPRSPPPGTAAAAFRRRGSNSASPPSAASAARSRRAGRRPTTVSPAAASVSSAVWSSRLAKSAVPVVIKKWLQIEFRRGQSLMGRLRQLRLRRQGVLKTLEKAGIIKGMSSPMA